jgi:hypothetical protein
MVSLQFCLEEFCEKLVHDWGLRVFRELEIQLDPTNTPTYQLDVATRRIVTVKDIFSHPVRLKTA